MKWKNDTLNLHRVHVEFSGREVRDLLLDRVSEVLNLDKTSVQTHLRVDLNDGVDSTTYVRGEVPLTREQLLESLGLTPTEPVETEGAAVAEEFAHPTWPPQAPDLILPEVALTTDDVNVVRDEGGRLFGALLRDEASSVIDRVVRTLRRIPVAVAEVRRHVDVLARVSPDSVDVAATARVLEEAARLSDGTTPPVGHDLWPLKLISEDDVESLVVAVRKIEADGHAGSRTYQRLVEVLSRLRPGPAVGDNPGVQLGAGAYAPESEVLPEVQVARTEDPATLTVDHVVNDLSQILYALVQARRSDLAPVTRTHVSSATALTEALRDLLAKYSGCVLTEGRDPLVPRRGPTTDSVETAREKVKQMYECKTHHGQEVRAQDLAYLYTLLGGEGEL